jgi:polysaccharide biosynthesis protein PslH
MKILLVVPMVPRRDGPGAIPVLLHAQLMGLRARHDVTAVTAVGDEPGEVEAVEELRREGIDLRVADRRRPPAGRHRRQRRRRLAGSWMRGSWPWRTVWFAAPGIQLEIDRALASRRFDLVAAEDSAMSVFSLPPGLPRVLTEHEVRRPRRVAWTPPPRPGEALRWAFGELDWQRWPAFQRGAWERFDLVQAFSRRDAAAIAELAPGVADRVRVNPFGLEPPDAADPAREQAGAVLFVGNFTHPPNRDAARWLAEEIMPAVRAKVENARLQLVGSAPPREVRALAGPHVTVVADAPAVDPYVEAAAVVLAPVRTGGGMRMKVLHALAGGKAVVTTPRGAEGYLGDGHPAPFAVAEDAGAIASATAELLADGERRRALGRRARRFAIDNHSPAAWAERLEAVYEEAREMRLG